MLSNGGCAARWIGRTCRKTTCGRCARRLGHSRPDNFHADNAIDLRVNEEVAAIDIRLREITLSDGNSIGYDRLLLATASRAVPTMDPWRE